MEDSIKINISTKFGKTEVKEFQNFLSNLRRFDNFLFTKAGNQTEVDQALTEVFKAYLELTQEERGKLTGFFRRD